MTFILSHGPELKFVTGRNGNLMSLPGNTVSQDTIWDLLRNLKQTTARNEVPKSATSIGWDNSSGLVFNSDSDSTVLAVRDGTGDWLPVEDLPTTAREMLLLYLTPATVSKDRPFITGHLGQSIDGRIAASNGSSHYVTGPENILHLHRMRALSDAVVVGARTVELDDPQLTTRKVSGPDPVRVIIDPTRRIPTNHKIFNEAHTPTIVVCDKRFVGEVAASPSNLKVLGLNSNEGGISPRHVVDNLFAMGLTSLFIEGGGVTVSRFLQAGVLTRLQVAIAPILIGDGIPSITLREIYDLSEALRPPCRKFSFGQDVMFDFDMSQ